jgi:hypothetical protein
MAKKTAKTKKEKATEEKVEVKKETTKAKKEVKVIAPDKIITLVNKSKSNQFVPYAGDVMMLNPNHRVDVKERLLGAIPKEVRVIKK